MTHTFISCYAATFRSCSRAEATSGCMKSEDRKVRKARSSGMDGRFRHAHDFNLGDRRSMSHVKQEVNNKLFSLTNIVTLCYVNNITQVT